MNITVMARPGSNNGESDKGNLPLPISVYNIKFPSRWNKIGIVYFGSDYSEMMNARMFCLPSF